MHRPVADRKLLKDGLGKRGPNALSMIMIGSMRPHALRESLGAPILNPTNDTAVVEDMCGCQANEAFDLALLSVKR
jgi:hypothetical protein